MKYSSKALVVFVIYCLFSISMTAGIKRVRQTVSKPQTMTCYSSPPSVKQQSGVAKMDQTLGWQADGKHGYMGAGSGSRVAVTAVKFTQPFSSVPTVVVNLKSFDAAGQTAGDSVRLNVKATDVTTSGFNLKFNTWAGTKIWGTSASWIAYTN